MPATSSPDASISTLETASLNLANDTSNANNPDLNDHSKELDGMRTVNITPTEKNSVHGIDERHSVSPPLVLKSVPTTPLTGKFQQEAEGPTTLSHATLSELDSSRETPMDDEDDPRELVISSLRVQISDLFSQVTLLNSKLVQSYDRVSHLEETLDENTEKLQALEGERLNLENEKVVLEIERNKYEGMLKDGSLVERATIAAELNRYVAMLFYPPPSLLLCLIALCKNPWNLPMHENRQKKSMLGLSLSYRTSRLIYSARPTKWYQRSAKLVLQSSSPFLHPKRNVCVFRTRLRPWRRA